MACGSQCSPLCQGVGFVCEALEHSNGIAVDGRELLWSHLFLARHQRDRCVRAGVCGFMNGGVDDVGHLLHLRGVRAESAHVIGRCTESVQ